MYKGQMVFSQAGPADVLQRGLSVPSLACGPIVCPQLPANPPRLPEGILEK